MNFDSFRLKLPVSIWFHPWVARTRGLLDNVGGWIIVLAEQVLPEDGWNFVGWALPGMIQTGKVSQVKEGALEAGELLELRLESWGRLGEAMARHEGWDVFVFGGIPGERVVAEVLKVRRRYVAARVTEVLEPSPHRVEAPCRYFGECTGCQWQHLDYEAQLAAKREIVCDALERVGGLTGVTVSPTLPSPMQLGYRNHARFTVKEQGALGFVNRENRLFVRIESCMLMHRQINHLLADLQGRRLETTQLSIRAGQETGDYLVQPLLFLPDSDTATGQKRYRDSVDGREFNVSSPSFFQVNAGQASQLVQVVREGLGLDGSEVLVDAYTGVGTFAILLAPYVKRVLAVEESAAAVADARENAAGIENVEFLLGKTEDVLQGLEQPPDAVVLDPPRTGCQAQALEKLAEFAPRRIAYVSCDAETLARDLKILCQGGYRLERVAPLDMFPQTHHVEAVAFLSLEEPPGDRMQSEQVEGRRAAERPLLVLASASPRRAELLGRLELDFRVKPSNIAEDALPDESALDLVRRLSLAKASEVAKRMKTGFVVGADSLVVLDGQAYGKPEDAADARRMLQRLRGTRHQVATGVTVMESAGGRVITESMTSDITLRHISDAEIAGSIESGVPFDKAGAYAVQDEELRPAESWEGCYSNIVGLPLCRLVEMLDSLGFPLPPAREMGAPVGCTGHCPFVVQRGGAS